MTNRNLCSVFLFTGTANRRPTGMSDILNRENSFEMSTNNVISSVHRELGEHRCRSFESEPVMIGVAHLSVHMLENDDALPAAGTQTQEFDVTEPVVVVL